MSFVLKYCVTYMQYEQYLYDCLRYYNKHWLGVQIIFYNNNLQVSPLLLAKASSMSLMRLIRTWQRIKVLEVVVQSGNVERFNVS